MRFVLALGLVEVPQTTVGNYGALAELLGQGEQLTSISPKVDILTRHLDLFPISNEL